MAVWMCTMSFRVTLLSVLTCPYQVGATCFTAGLRGHTKGQQCRWLWEEVSPRQGSGPRPPSPWPCLVRADFQHLSLGSPATQGLGLFHGPGSPISLCLLDSATPAFPPAPGC